MFYSSLTVIEYSHVFLCFILRKYFIPYTHKVFKISYPHYNYVTSISLFFTKNFSIFITIANFLLFPTKKVSLDLVLCNKYKLRKSIFDSTNGIN